MLLHATILNIRAQRKTKFSDLSSLSHAETERPFLSLSVIKRVLDAISQKTSLKWGSHSDQSMSSARGEIPASYPGLYSPEQKYSIVVSSRNAFPCAKPGGTQIHSLNSSLPSEGMSYAMALPKVGEPLRMSRTRSTI